MRSLWRPYAYQGRSRKRNYFEGWYFRQVIDGGGDAFAFIPGISRGMRGGEDRAFVQAIGGRPSRSVYAEYPASAFHASERDLDIRVGPNRFSWEGLQVGIDGPDGGVEADLRFTDPVLLPQSPFSPGIMGPFAFVPFMECNHGLVSLDHGVQGTLRFGGRIVRMDAGRGYAEKDWGSSMPERWIWTQCNGFPVKGDSVMLSVARIPWLGSSFTGFLCVARLGGTIHRFTTYDGSRLVHLSVADGGALCVLGRGPFRLELAMTGAGASDLRAPVNGLMTRRIGESVDARLDVLLSRSGTILFSGTGTDAGLEIAGDAAGLAPRK